MIETNTFDDIQILNSFDELTKKFNEIKKLGWIENKSNGNGAGGITLEILLGKERENFEIPDYEGIEIKTTTQRGYKIGLFNSAPDNELFEIKRLINEYGYLNNYSTKVFRFYVNAVTLNKLPNGYFVKLKVDDEKKLIKLLIFDNNNILIEDKVSWSFKILEEKLFRKLKYLALVNVLKKNKNKKIYYKYTELKKYKLREFDQFINLIDTGNIKIKFNVVELTQSDGSKKTYDHGTSFDLGLEDINKLFIKL